ncbi:MULTISPECIES: hypothetical protein [Staphylococcus]|uniref:hypothetical protein n=1 Tax=Staphylococcus TaxID=1279 RepID=UPI0008A4BE65|nr:MULTISPECIES: hypothetical protein [Staphylococcus]MBO0385359.1 hypothetical protein [Staphylococcus haemolyticus]OFK34519.1 hypothetical protein HMPREF2821_04185 [Staphylococcus sp. HMSC065C10]
MKKFIYIISLVCLFAIVLTACSKDTKESMQGKWQAKNMETISDMGENIEIKDNNINVKDSNFTENNKVKYFMLNKKNQSKIKIYIETPKDSDFDKELPEIEGTIKVKDDKMTIKTKDGYKYKYEKE